MGNVVSDIVKTIDRSDEKEARTKEQLEMLMKLADARLDTFQEQLNRMFLDKQCLRQSSVSPEKVPFVLNDLFESMREWSVDQAVEAFFGASKTDSEGVLEGFKAVVKTDLKTILGDISAGESYDEKFFVCIKHNAIIHVDMMTYRYNFHNEGVISTHKNLLAYILCISVVDHMDVTVDEILYLASEFAGDEPEQYEAYLNNLIRVWNGLQANSAKSADTRTMLVSTNTR